MPRYNLFDDVRALIKDGHTDGLVHSDWAYDNAFDDLRAGTTTIDREVAKYSAQYRSDLTDGDAEAAGADLPEFLKYPDGLLERGQRPAADTQRLLDAYLAAWESSFRSRLEDGLRRAQEEDGGRGGGIFALARAKGTKRPRSTFMLEPQGKGDAAWAQDLAPREVYRAGLSGRTADRLQHKVHSPSWFGRNAEVRVTREPLRADIEAEILKEFAEATRSR